jgi:hypothetical protein
MARMIIIAESELDRLFDETLKTIALGRWSSKIEGKEFENSPIGELHSAFQYHVCRLKDKVKES